MQTPFIFKRQDEIKYIETRQKKSLQIFKLNEKIKTFLIQLYTFDICLSIILLIYLGYNL